MAARSMIHSMPTEYQEKLASIPDVDGENVTKVKVKNGKIVKIKQHGKQSNQED